MSLAPEGDYFGETSEVPELPDWLVLGREPGALVLQPEVREASLRLLGRQAGYGEGVCLLAGE